MHSPFSYRPLGWYGADLMWTNLLISMNALDSEQGPLSVTSLWVAEDTMILISLCKSLAI